MHEGYFTDSAFGKELLCHLPDILPCLWVLNTQGWVYGIVFQGPWGLSFLAQTYMEEKNMAILLATVTFKTFER